MGNDWNDEVTYVHAIGGDWILYTDTSFSGMTWCVKEGQGINVPSYFNDKLTSLRTSKIISFNAKFFDSFDILYFQT